MRRCTGCSCGVDGRSPSLSTGRGGWTGSAGAGAGAGPVERATTSSAGGSSTSSARPVAASVEERARGGGTPRLRVGADGGQRRVGVPCDLGAVEADHRQLGRGRRRRPPAARRGRRWPSGRWRRRRRSGGRVRRQQGGGRRGALGHRRSRCRRPRSGVRPCAATASSKASPAVPGVLQAGVAGDVGEAAVAEVDEVVPPRRRRRGRRRGRPTGEVRVRRGGRPATAGSRSSASSAHPVVVVAQVDAGRRRRPGGPTRARGRPAPRPPRRPTTLSTRTRPSPDSTDSMPAMNAA